MKIPAAVPLAILLTFAMLFAPVSASSVEDFDTDVLDIPELEAMDYSETPLRTLESLAAYAEHLIEAAEELLNFVDSIFEMLGMEENSEVKELMDVLENGANMANK